MDKTQKNKIKKEIQEDNDPRRGMVLESQVDPVDTKTGIGEAENNLKRKK